METYHLIKIDPAGNEKDFKAQSFSDFLALRSEFVQGLQPGEELHTFYSNDEYIQFNYRIIECDTVGPYQLETKGKRELKNRGAIQYIVNNLPWVEKYAEKITQNRLTKET